MRDNPKTTSLVAIAVWLMSGAALAALGVAWVVVYSPLNQPAPAPTEAAKQAKPTEAAPPRAPEQAVKDATAAVDALSKTLGPPASKPAESSGGAPVFDVARIGPTGDAVIAGRAEPGATVELLRDGVVHDKAVANQSGEFVIVPNPLPPGEYRLTLRATRPDGTVSTSEKSVAVSLQGSKTAAARPEPSARPEPTARPEPKASASAPAAAEPRKADIRIVTIDSPAGGKLSVSGQAEPGATVRLYLNGSYIASATASAAGSVVFAIESGVVAGDYRVRLDVVDGTTKVLANAEQLFRAPAPSAVASSAAATPPKPDNAESASAPKATEPKSSPSPSNVAAANNAGPVARQPAPAETPPPGPAVAARTETPRPQAPMEKPAAKPEPTTPQATAEKPVPAPLPPLNPTGTGQQLAASPPVPNLLTPPDSKSVVVVPSIDTAAVRRGDNLWNISRSTYGEGVQYFKIYDANRDKIRDPDLIFPGQVFVLPKTPAGE